MKNCLLSGPSSKQAQNKIKHRSQDSISSQNTNKSSSRRDRVVYNENDIAFKLVINIQTQST